jgi:hypothetical protein
MVIDEPSRAARAAGDSRRGNTTAWRFLLECPVFAGGALLLGVVLIQQFFDEAALAEQRQITGLRLRDVPAESDALVPCPATSAPPQQCADLPM